LWGHGFSITLRSVSRKAIFIVPLSVFLSILGKNITIVREVLCLVPLVNPNEMEYHKT